MGTVIFQKLSQKIIVAKYGLNNPDGKGATFHQSAN
jgi:hypothetical protein